jgi:hypothetical protein
MPAQQEARRFFQDLLALPDHVSVVSWVAEHRSEDAARIAGTAALRTIREAMVGLRAAHDAGWELADQGRPTHWLIDEQFLDYLEQERRTILSSDELRAHLRELGEAMVGEGMAVRPVASDLTMELGYELLDLPPGIDPIKWLTSDARDTSASVAVKAVVDQARPSQPIDVGPPTRVRTLQVGATVGMAEVAVRVERVLLGPGGFLVIASAKISRQVLRRAKAELVSWEGFDEAIDDLGYSYLRTAVEGATSSGWRGKKTTLKIRFYPAVVASAARLTLRCGESAWTGAIFRPEGRPGLVSIPVEPLAVTVDLR